jgi:uncharacterized protein YukE
VNNPLVAERQDSTTGYTGVGIVESAVDLYHGVENGSWVEGGLGLVGTGLEMLSLVLDPLGTLLQYAVSWIIEHVGPLRDALNWLAGDADQIAAYAQTWQNVSEAVSRAKEDFTSEVANGTAGWSGATADAYRKTAATQAEHITAASSCSGTIGTVVQVVGVLVGTVRGIVRDLVAECVATLIARIPQWLAEEAVTLGFATPHVVAAAVTIIAKWVNKISDIITKLVRSVAKLRPLMTRLTEIWEAIKKGLRGLRKTTPNAPHSGPPNPVKPHTTPDVNPHGGTTTPSSPPPTTHGGDPVSTPPQTHGGDTGGTTTTSGTHGGQTTAPPTTHGGDTGGTTHTSGGGGEPPSNGGNGGSGKPPHDGDPTPSAPSPGDHPALPRRPKDLAEPHPELTPAERQALDQHHSDLEAKNPEKFSETNGDPDHNGKVRKHSEDEARIALDLQERGDFDSGYHRPTGPGQGDFITGDGTHWDMKSVHSDWPPGVPDDVRARPYPNGYNEADFRATVTDQFGKGRNVVLDTRNASDAHIADMVRIVKEEGWGGRIIWYP